MKSHSKLGEVGYPHFPKSRKGDWMEELEVEKIPNHIFENWIRIIYPELIVIIEDQLDKKM